MPTLDLPLPAWLNRLPKKQREVAKQRFLLKLAALYYSESGHLRDLSLACGYAERSFAVLACRGKMSPETAKRIEALLGGPAFARERLCPHVFERGSAAPNAR